MNIGLIETFLEELPGKALQLSLRVLLAALALLIGIQLIKLLRRIAGKALKRGHVDESAIHFIDSMVKFGLYFVLIVMIASSIGVDAASIVAILGSAGVAVGLALQGSLSNLAGGVLLLILKPFVAGDYIKDSKGNEGTVIAVDVFYTHLTTVDNKTIVLPNGNLANECITNYTKCDNRRIDIQMGVSYEADIREVKEVLEKVLDEDSGVLQELEKTVFVDNLGNSSVIMNVRCFADVEQYWNTKWRLTEAIKYALEEANIKIPYPQMDVHLSK